MLNPFATLRHLLDRSAPQSQPYSQKQLVDLLFHQRQCPHCHATGTLSVIPESEAGAFDFDLSCATCATEYEVRPTPHWYDCPQEIKVRATRDRLYTLQPEASLLNITTSPLQPAFNG